MQVASGIFPAESGWSQNRIKGQDWIRLGRRKLFNRLLVKLACLGSYSGWSAVAAFHFVLISAAMHSWMTICGDMG